MTIRQVQSGDAAHRLSGAGASEQLRKVLEAARRALPVQRLVGNGMDLADALSLHQFTTDGVAWELAATTLGDDHLRRADLAEAQGHRTSAVGYLEYAAACFRFGQSQFFHDTEEKVALYRRSLDAFTRAAALRDPPYLKVEIPFGAGAMSGWLIRPPGVACGPTVIVFGGADGWREEYHKGALYLVERGLSVFLLDGPGQGETRLLRKLYLVEPPEHALSTVVSTLLERVLASRVGVWGNSLGGNFAARVASFDHRLAACCSNSGAADPHEAIELFPRIGDRFGALRGERDDLGAAQLCDQLRLAPEDNRIACPLLVLHGGADRLFSQANMQSLYDHAPSTDKTMLIWRDGDHCIYNHSHEKHCAVADWFAERLA